MSVEKMRRDLIDLGNQRAKALEDASKAYDEGRSEDCTTMTAKAKDLGDQMQSLKDKIAEQDRQILVKGPTPSEARDMAEDRGAKLMRGESVSIGVDEARRAVMNSVTLATGTLVEPTGTGSNIRDPLGNTPSSIVDQVYVQNLTGMGAYLEPYVISETDAKGGKVTTNAGTARAASVDPTFGVAKISPYELNITNYIDRNISRLSPADYYNKVFGMSMRAFRRKLALLIPNGDGQASPDMFGMKNAKNQAGDVIYSTVNVNGIDENLLDNLYYGYGSDEAIGPNGRLFLTKEDLKAIGKLRNSDKERIFKVIPDPGNLNTGRIEDGGNSVPYTIVPGLTSLSTATASSSGPIQTMLYGDPSNYEMGLFGDYSIRVDESIKGVERMVTILGDAMVGGNLIVHRGIVVATVPKSGS